MVSNGLLVRVEVQPGKDAAVEEFLRSAVPLVNDEPGTIAWFAIRFGRSEYGIFDVFDDEAGREAHLTGAVAKALFGQVDALFTGAPQVQKLDVLASKFPSKMRSAPVAKALLLTLKSTEGREREVEELLRGAQPLVEEEPLTTAWFAVKLAAGEYAIFDVFEDNGGRFAHLTGRVPVELAKHATALFGGLPDMEMPTILAEKLASAV